MQDLGPKVDILSPQNQPKIHHFGTQKLTFLHQFGHHFGTFWCLFWLHFVPKRHPKGHQNGIQNQNSVPPKRHRICYTGSQFPSEGFILCPKRCPKRCQNDPKTCSKCRQKNIFCAPLEHLFELILCVSWAYFLRFLRTFGTPQNHHLTIGAQWFFLLRVFGMVLKMVIKKQNFCSQIQEFAC